MKIKYYLTGILFVFAFGMSVQSFAFNAGDVIVFDPGEFGCIYPEYPQFCEDTYSQGVVSGSYVAIDADGSGSFSIHERVAISPGPDGGIIVGQLQPASGSHMGCPDGTENASLDVPWCFFNVTGMHQVTGSPVLDNGDGTLDFSGWGVTWNGIENIDFGGYVPFGDTGLATLDCTSDPCSPEDAYTIDYYAHVPAGDPSNLGGLPYQLHLEHEAIVPKVKVSISVTGGNTQECAAIGGHDVSVLANIQLLNGAVLDVVTWTVDGNDAGFGENISSFLSLGSHIISVTAMATTGQQDSATATVNLVDTTAPVIRAAFIDKHSGYEITTIDTKNASFVGVIMTASDICDAAPSVNGIGGFVLIDGDMLKVQGNLNKVELTTSMLHMQATSSDVSGNSSGISKALSITP